jgi:hypothetical protein
MRGRRSPCSVLDRSSESSSLAGQGSPVDGSRQRMSRPRASLNVGHTAVTNGPRSASARAAACATTAHRWSAVLSISKRMLPPIVPSAK